MQFNHLSAVYIWLLEVFMECWGPTDEFIMWRERSHNNKNDTWTATLNILNTSLMMHSCMCDKINLRFILIYADICIAVQIGPANKAKSFVCQQFTRLILFIIKALRFGIDAYGMKEEERQREKESERGRRRERWRIKTKSKLFSSFVLYRKHLVVDWLIDRLR